MQTVRTLPRIKVPNLSYSRVFSDTPEESLRLRTLVMLAVLWVALSLNWLTGAPWIPGIAASGAALGNLVSWRLRLSPLRLRTVAIVVGIIGLTAVYRDAAVVALTGDRLPVAEYLILVTAVASFGLRTRGGLYGQLALSGLVLFFVSERAFDPAFVGFLIVYTGIFLTFSAMAFMEDQISIARVHWPEGQLGRFWFWLAIVGGGLLVCSALAFSLLPPDYRGRPGTQRVGIVPFMGEAGAQLDQGGNAGGIAQDRFEEPGSLTVRDAPSGSGADALREFTAALPSAFDAPEAVTNPREVVMNVRSGVTSFWRGGIYDEFDGQTWYRSRDLVVERAQPKERNFYWQAYFLKQDQPGELFIGYKPLRVILPDEIEERGELFAGSTYSVLSQQQPLTAERVRLERTGRVRSKYRSLDGTTTDLRDLAGQLTEDAGSPFEALWMIVSHLRQNHTFNLAATDQLTLTGGVDEFLVEGTSGTSLDFASATVLMARAVGIPARVAVGYLPGKFERFSGTREVKRRDRHAWAEVNFTTFGWVAFDASPRPEINRFMTGGPTTFPGGALLFETRVGGGLYRYLQSGASSATGALEGALRGKGDTIRAGGIAVVGLLLVGMLAIWLLYWRPRRGRGQWPYSRLEGEHRVEVLKLFANMERLLARKGLPPREPSQTLADYSDSAAGRFATLGPDISWLSNAAWSAAYDPDRLGPGLVDEAKGRLRRIRESMRRIQKRGQ